MKSKSLVLLSGENATLPAAEAKSLFLMYDPSSTFEEPEERVIVADSEADPFAVGRRIAFARRVGRLVSGTEDARALLEGRKARVRGFTLSTDSLPVDEASALPDVELTVDLKAPELELTVVRGKRDYHAVSSPLSMQQGWSLRRPRRRAFFHPASMFPKLSRALVNLSRCREGDLFLDPFAGVGSLPIEAYIIGAAPLAADLDRKMTAGSLANMKQLGQRWLGVLRADALNLPLNSVGAVATDLPYGRASSTGGKGRKDILERFLATVPDLLRPGSFAVVMHPKDVKVDPGEGLTLEYEHHIYVHKLLTRTISVLRRK